VPHRREGIHAKAKAPACTAVHFASIFNAEQRSHDNADGACVRPADASTASAFNADLNRQFHPE
jgi:hypothetical protein